MGRAYRKALRRVGGATRDRRRTKMPTRRPRVVFRVFPRFARNSQAVWLCRAPSLARSGGAPTDGCAARPIMGHI